MKLASILAAALLVSAAVDSAPAQERYPARPVKIIVPFAPGGAVDIVGRIIGERMSASMGQSIVIENKPGAHSITALEELARAKPDGYTLMFGNNNSNVITPVLYPKSIPFSVEDKITPVARLADLPALLVATTKDFAPKSFADFVAYAKQHPGDVRYSSVGVGSFPHVDMELLALRAGFTARHIPNKSGASGMVTDLITGAAQVAFLNSATAGPMVRSGDLRVLAAISDRRLPEYPDLPTLAELGYPGVGTVQWIGLFAPSGVPEPVLASLHATAVAAAEEPSVQRKFQQQSIRSVPTASVGEARRFVADEFARWRKIVREVKLDVGE